MQRLITTDLVNGYMNWLARLHLSTEVSQLTFFQRAEDMRLTSSLERPVKLKSKL